MDALPARKSIRFEDYDYSGSGGYFVTLCVQYRHCLFGDVDIVGADPRVCPNGVDAGAGGHVGPPLHQGNEPLRVGPEGTEPVHMQLSPAGEMIERWWNKIPSKFPGIELDAFVVMPNHVHFIVINKTGIAKGAHPDGICPSTAAGGHVGPPLLGTIVQWFKTMTTNEYIRGVKEQGWPRFEGRLWQRNYWERIVRDEEWDSMREYIHNNPITWATDKLNPESTM